MPERVYGSRSVHPATAARVLKLLEERRRFGRPTLRTIAERCQLSLPTVRRFLIQPPANGEGPERPAA